MRRQQLLILGGLMLFSASLVVMATSLAHPRQASLNSSKLKVAATIFPLYDVTKQITKDRAEVVLILPPGASPHTFDLRPSDVENLMTAQIVFQIGHRLDDWIAKAIEQNQRLQIVRVDANIQLLKASEDDGVNPHYWLSLDNMQIIARNITQALIVLDPTNAQFYKSNLEEYSQELAQTKEELLNLRKQLPSNQIATFHDAWDYLAQEFDFKIVATFEPSGGKEPPPEYLHRFQQKIASHHVKVLFAEPQLSANVLRSVAHDLDLAILELDPLGGLPGRETYLKMMRYNINTISQALHARS